MNSSVYGIKIEIIRKRLYVRNVKTIQKWCLKVAVFLKRYLT